MTKFCIRTGDDHVACERQLAVAAQSKSSHRSNEDFLAGPQDVGNEKLLNPARRRACIEHVRGELKVSERRVCMVLGQHRSTQRLVSTGRDDEERLTADIIELAR